MSCLVRLFEGAIKLSIKHTGCSEFCSKVGSTKYAAVSDGGCVIVPPTTVAKRPGWHFRAGVQGEGGIHMADGEEFRLPLASLPDGALAILLSFGEVPDLIAANQVRVRRQSYSSELHRLNVSEGAGESEHKTETRSPTPLCFVAPWSLRLIRRFPAGIEGVDRREGREGPAKMLFFAQSQPRTRTPAKLEKEASNLSIRFIHEGVPSVGDGRDQV